MKNQEVKKKPLSSKYGFQDIRIGRTKSWTNPDEFSKIRKSLLAFRDKSDGWKFFSEEKFGKLYVTRTR